MHKAIRKSRAISNESMYNLEKNVTKRYTAGFRMDAGFEEGVFGAIFRAEVHYIGRCAQLKLDSKYYYRKIALLPDSQSVIKEVGSHVIK